MYWKWEQLENGFEQFLVFWFLKFKQGICYKAAWSVKETLSLKQEINLPWSDLRFSIRNETKRSKVKQHAEQLILQDKDKCRLRNKLSKTRKVHTRQKGPGFIKWNILLDSCCNCPSRSVIILHPFCIHFILARIGQLHTSAFSNRHSNHRQMYWSSYLCYWIWPIQLWSFSYIVIIRKIL